MLSLSLYQGDIETSFQLVVLLVCLLLLSFVLWIVFSIPVSANTKYSHDTFGWQKWQTVELPILCSGCSSPIEAHNLEWRKPGEANCPSCSIRVDIRIALIPKPENEKSKAEKIIDDDVFESIFSGGTSAIIGLGLTAVLSQVEWAILFVPLGVSLLLIGLIFMSVGILKQRRIVQNTYGEYSKQKWQVVELPISCSECNHPIEIHSLKWVGFEEAQCPNCSSRIDLEIGVVIGSRLKSEYR